MNKVMQSLKIMTILLALGTALAGCERQSPDQAATESSGAQASRSEAATESQSAGSAMQRAERVVDDSVITTKAKSALLADTTVNGSEIRVETNQGIVTLSGNVKNDKQRERAASIVRGLDGVKSVENEIALKQ